MMAHIRMTDNQDEPAQQPASSLCGTLSATPELNANFVLTKCDYFVDVQLWPLIARLNPKRWLSNFTQAESPYAIHLLNAFLYFNQSVMDQLLSAAFQALSQLIHDPRDAYLASQARWRQFIDTVIVTCVRGEEPNATDSGFRFLRMARQVLAIPQERILSPEDALAVVAAGRRSPVVFLDDFVGSGNQFTETWTRKVPLPEHAARSVSFEDLAMVMRNLQCFYCPLICTEKGRRAIVHNCPTVTLNPAHLLTDNYSATATNSIIWPRHLRGGARAFIQQASARAGVLEWEGFHGLALALAFEHSVPDATLPIFYWKENGWKPLIERT
jgi:hypothetical protein